MTAQRGSAIYTLLRLLAACCVVVVGVIAAQLIMQRFELDGGTGTPPVAEPAPTVADTAEPVAAVEPEPLPTAPAPSDEDGVPYQVQATFISDPPTFSRALLRGPDGQSKWYLTGQEPASGIVLKEIRKDRVVFTWRGEEREQLLKRDAQDTVLKEPLRGADAPLPQPYAKPAPPGTSAAAAGKPDAGPGP